MLGPCHAVRSTCGMRPNIGDAEAGRSLEPRETDERRTTKRQKRCGHIGRQGGMAQLYAGLVQDRFDTFWRRALPMPKGFGDVQVLRLVLANDVCQPGALQVFRLLLGNPGAVASTSLLPSLMSRLSLTMNPKNTKSSFSKREKIRRNPLNRRNNRSTSLRRLYTAVVLPRVDSCSQRRHHGRTSSPRPVAGSRHPGTRGP